MEGIVVLCHFCEQHGPSVILCTQPFYAGVKKLKNSLQNPANLPAFSSSCGNFNTMSFEPAWRGEASNKAIGQLYDMIISSVSTKPNSGGQDSNILNQPIGGCRACSFFTHEEIGFTSEDFSSHSVFTSSQLPIDPKLVTAVRSACMRSLSTEVLPGSEGPIYFGDDIGGHVISYAFFIKDAFARGSQRKFSFLLISFNQIFLLNIWPFVEKNFECMCSRLQRAALNVYYEDVSAGSRSVTPPETSMSRSCRTPPRSGMMSVTPPIRLCPTSPTHLFTSPSDYVNAPFINSHAIAAGNPVAASHYYIGSIAIGAPGRKTGQRRETGSEMRSLVDLTKDEQIFYRIHAWFTWLLRLSVRYWTVQPGPQGPPNEDQLYEYEEREIHDSLSGAFSNLSTGKMSSGDNFDFSASHPFPLPNCVISPNNLTIGQSLGWSDGNLEVETDLQLRLLNRLYKCVGEETFSRIVHHLTTGNQITVLPLEHTSLGSMTVAALARFLPRGCIRMIIESTEYVPSIFCNLLSLTSDLSSTYESGTQDRSCLILQISLHSLIPSTEASSCTENVEESEDSEVCNILNSLHFAPTFGYCFQSKRVNKLKNTTVNTNKDPNLSISSNQTSSEFVRSSLVRQIVNLFQMEPPLKSSTLNLSLTKIRKEWVDKIRLLFSFTKCQSSLSVNEESIKKNLCLMSPILNTLPEDEVFIIFWIKSLSQYTRQRSCHPKRPTLSPKKTSCGTKVTSTTPLLQ